MRVFDSFYIHTWGVCKTFCCIQVRYSRLLEEGDFRGRTGDFVWFLLFCAVLMTGAAPFLNMNFLGRPLAFMMVYVWGRYSKMVYVWERYSSG